MGFPHCCRAGKNMSHLKLLLHMTTLQEDGSLEGVTVKEIMDTWTVQMGYPVVTFVRLDTSGSREPCKQCHLPGSMMVLARRQQNRSASFSTPRTVPTPLMTMSTSGKTQTLHQHTFMRYTTIQHHCKHKTFCTVLHCTLHLCILTSGLYLCPTPQP